MKTLFRRLLQSLLLLPSLVSATTLETPDLTLQRLTTEVFSRLEQREQFMRENPDQLEQIGVELVNELVLPIIDMELVSRWIIGKSWKEAGSQQRQQFIDEFTHMLIRTYANALLEFRGKRVEFMPFHHDARRKDAVVKAEFHGISGSPPIPVWFRVVQRGTDSPWRVFDVIVDQVSLVKNYRSSFSAEIRKVGFDGLIARLVKHNRGE